MICTFCELPSYTGSYVTPTMCAKHFDLALAAHQAARMGFGVTRRSIMRVVQLMPPDARAKMAFLPKEIDTLLRQMRKGGYVFPEESRRPTQTVVGANISQVKAIRS